MNISFGSDNHSGVHPLILQAIEQANTAYQPAYGDDDYTQEAMAVFKQHFGPDANVFFAFNGTGANVLCLKALTDSFNAIICPETAHINVDECGAPERVTGAKLLTVPTKDGKLRPDDVLKHLHGFGFQHHAQPKVISISQVTELGTVYSPDEIRDLAQLAHKYGLYLHMDGSRLANAAASLNLDFKSFTVDCGVDALSFGGTKNGMLLGEAVILFHPELAANFPYIRKQAMQLYSKSRFVAAQYLAYFKNDLWKSNALQANKMASYLRECLLTVPGVQVTQQVESNAVFAIIPKEVCEPLMKKYCFYIWDESTGEVRWMCAYNTEKSHIELFIEDLKNLSK